MRNDDRGLWLRIGVLLDGRIFDEKFIPPGKSASLGSGRGNSICVPLSDLPRHFELFSWAEGRCQLHFDSRLSGAIQSGSLKAQLGAIAEQGLATRTRSGHVVVLKNDARGRLKFGDVVVLFQFVAAPPRREKLRLPADMSRPFRSIDKRLFTIVVMSALMHFTALWWIEQQPPRQTQSISYEDLNRFVSFPTPEVVEKEVTMEAEVAAMNMDGEREVVDDTPERKQQAVASRDGGEDAPDDLSELTSDKLSMVDEVKKGNILELFGKLGEGGDVVSSMLDHSNSIELARAFDESSRLAHGSSESPSIRSPRGEGSRDSVGQRVGGIELPSSGSAGNKKVDLGSRQETRVKSLVRIPERDIAPPSGPVDMRAVLAILRRHEGAIKNCYDRHLTRFPDAQGRVLVAVTLATNGRVSKVDLVNDDIGGQAGQCIARVIRRIDFNMHLDSEATMRLPFVFMQGG